MTHGLDAPIRTLAVLGAGAWGVALAQTAARAGRDVLLWCRRKDQAVEITARGDTDRLPGVSLSPRIRAIWRIEDAAAAEAVLAATPAQHAREVLGAFAPHAAPGVPIVLCSKGIERGTRLPMSQVLLQTAPQATPAVLSGPGFAGEVGRGLPTATTIACEDRRTAARLAEALGHATFRPYVTDDVIGAEVGGAVKNVLAIACGVASGRKLGAGAQAALITRGLAEMTRFAVALGGREETVQGLSGLGDLVLTCTNMTSRNFSFGHAVGMGKRIAEVLADRREVTEGVATAPALAAAARERGVEMPICFAVDDLVAGRTDVEAAMTGLLSRPLKAEAAA